MEYRLLGRTGVQVSHWCLGALMFGRLGNGDHASCERIIHMCLDAGINFIDTADSYSQGESEEIVGRALAGRREDVILASKCFMPMGDGLNQSGGSRRWIMRAVENSLRRLRTDYIDLYQLHRLDPAVDTEESLSAMSDLVRQGKVRMIGTSVARAEQLVECQWIADRRGFERVRCEQPPYSIFTRAIEADVLPTCQRYGMGTIVWGPLNGGWLTGKYRPGAVPPQGSRASRKYMKEEWWDWESTMVRRKFELLEELSKLAADAGIPLAHLALAFAVEHPGVTAAIIGPRTEAQCQELLAGCDVRLSPDVLDRIDELVPPGTNVDPTTSLDLNAALKDERMRRRSAGPTHHGMSTAR